MYRSTTVLLSNSCSYGTMWLDLESMCTVVYRYRYNMFTTLDVDLDLQVITLNHHIPAQLEAGESLQIPALHRPHEVETFGEGPYQPLHYAGKDRAH